jgi:23S rRNA (cytosine1962-C5)-methyltransferase
MRSLPRSGRSSTAGQTTARSDGSGRLRLRKKLEERLAAGHPWIYAEALEPSAVLQRGQPGQVVEVEDAQGRFVARGRLDPTSPIAVRVWTLRPDEPLDDALVEARVAQALDLRRGLGLGTDPAELDAYRLLNGEGDRLPGVVADRYGPVVVLKLDGATPLPALPAVVRALATSLGPAGVTSLFLRGGDEKTEGRVLHGDEPAEELTVREHGARFAVDVRRGQKTGLFLDQRDNRQRVARLSAGASVLNLFCYTGGFSVAAALGGARHTTSVDQAQPALAAAARTFTLNGLDLRDHALVRADVFTYLTELATASRRFDIVVCDPPSFAPNERSLRRALRAYAELNRLAAGVVAPGGLLATASCSSHVRDEAFLETVSAGLGQTRRAARVVGMFGQPADHPTPPAFPEGRYLKLALIRLD